MTLEAFLARLVVVVGVMVAVAAVAIVGPARLRGLGGSYRSRGRAAAPYVGLLLVVLVVNRLARRLSDELSWLLRWNITSAIYELEGAFVARIQGLATPLLTDYSSFVYVYGYVFLLVFPLVAYFALEDQEPFRQTTVAYAVNYTLGLVCYVLFIAYGPRNLMPELVDSLLFTHWPESSLLTSRVNVNTNVFPSLHSSLSATVLILSYRTRDAYPGWFLLASVVATSVIVSTMYLGIHWVTDVAAGIVLACASVYVARRRTELWAGLRGATASLRGSRQSPPGRG